MGNVDNRKGNNSSFALGVAIVTRRLWHLSTLGVTPVGKSDSHSPYLDDPKGSFERVAALRQQIKQATKAYEISKASNNECRNRLKKLQDQLNDLIDVEVDPTVNLFSGVKIPEVTKPIAGDLASILVEKIGFTKNDLAALLKADLTDLGKINASRLDGGLNKLGFKDPAVKRIELAIQKYLTAATGGQPSQQAAPAAAPAPAAKEKKAKAKGGKSKAKGPKLAEGTEPAAASDSMPAVGA